MNSCSEIDNRYWYGVQVFVSNTTSLTDAEYCGYAGASRLISSPDVVGDQAAVNELMKNGGSVKCPEDVGTSQYVFIKFGGSGKRRPCNVGIFGCQCTNFVALARIQPIYPSSLDFVVLGAGYTAQQFLATDSASLVLSHTVTYDLPAIETHSECGSCSIGYVANFDDSVAPYLDVKIEALSPTSYQVTFTVTLDIPVADVPVSLQT